MPNSRIWQSVGRETILECTITALPQAISYWQKNGRRITNTIASAAAAAAADQHDVSDHNHHHVGDGRDVLSQSGAAKYRIEAYDEGDHTLTLNLRLQVTNAQYFYHSLILYPNKRVTVSWHHKLLSR